MAPSTAQRVFAWAWLLTGLVSACSSPPERPKKHGEPPPPARRCSTDEQCDAIERCMQSLCVIIPPPSTPNPVQATAHLRATPMSISFGAVPPGTSQRVALVLENDGDTMVTLSDVRVTPSEAGFRVAPLGTGPFWIRPGRSRAIFVEYAPTSAGPREGHLVVQSSAPELSVALRGD